MAPFCFVPLDVRSNVDHASDRIAVDYVVTMSGGDDDLWEDEYSTISLPFEEPGWNSAGVSLISPTIRRSGRNWMSEV